MRAKKQKEKAKIIHLPEKTIEGLDALAKSDRMTTKPYMEKVLIDHEKQKSK